MATRPTNLAVERPTYQIGPLCMSISVEDFRAWLADATPGQDIVYATGPVLDQKRDVVLLAGQYIAAGLIRTHRRKVEGRWEYFAVRRDSRVDGPTMAAPPAGQIEGLRGQMLALLRRAANLAQACPTNAELARQLNLKNGEAARYEFNQLVAGGHIRVKNYGPRMRRVVTIVASGKTTAKGAL